MATGQLCWTLPSANGAACGSPPSGSTTYNSDASGNQITSNPPSGTGESISYNPLGQTTSVTPAGSGTAVAMAYTGADSTQRTQAGSTAFTNNAFERDQCVAFAGVDSNVATTTSSTCSAVTVGRPGRGSSTKPSKRASKNLERHFPTVTAAHPSRPATSLFDKPSPQPKTIRDRNANA
jgi:hypothetical protein